jgi:hypothetical protein
VERSGLPDGTKVTILDPNRDVLEHTTRKLDRLEVTAVEADVLKPLPVDGPFDSAGMNMVIHLPARTCDAKGARDPERRRPSSRRTGHSSVRRSSAARRSTAGWAIGY